MVKENLALNHGRKASRKMHQHLGAVAGKVTRENKFEWEYELPEFEEVVKGQLELPAASSQATDPEFLSRYQIPVS